MQEFIIVIAFTTAVAYAGRLVYKSFQAKNGCATGCGKCDVESVGKFEKAIGSDS